MNFFFSNFSQKEKFIFVCMVFEVTFKQYFCYVIKDQILGNSVEYQNIGKHIIFVATP